MNIVTKTNVPRSLPAHRYASLGQNQALPIQFGAPIRVLVKSVIYAAERDKRADPTIPSMQIIATMDSVANGPGLGILEWFYDEDGPPPPTEPPVPAGESIPSFEEFLEKEQKLLGGSSLFAASSAAAASSSGGAGARGGGPAGVVAETKVGGTGGGGGSAPLSVFLDKKAKASEGVNGPTGGKKKEVGGTGGKKEAGGTGVKKGAGTAKKSKSVVVSPSPDGKVKSGGKKKNADA